MIARRWLLVVAIVLLVILVSDCIPFGLNATPVPEASVPVLLGL